MYFASQDSVLYCAGNNIVFFWQIAKLLQGTHKPIYDKTNDCGDYVVVTNAKDIVFTGNKWTQKLYRWHTGKNILQFALFNLFRIDIKEALSHQVY